MRSPGCLRLGLFGTSSNSWEGDGFLFCSKAEKTWFLHEHVKECVCVVFLHIYIFCASCWRTSVCLEGCTLARWVNCITTHQMYMIRHLLEREEPEKQQHNFWLFCFFLIALFWLYIDHPLYGAVTLFDCLCFSPKHSTFLWVSNGTSLQTHRSQVFSCNLSEFIFMKIYIWDLV